MMTSQENESLISLLINRVTSYVSFSFLSLFGTLERTQLQIVSKGTE